MNAKMKGGAKQKFEHKKQGVNEDILEYYDTKLQLYLHAYMMKARGTYRSLRD